jgi:Zn-dependent protease
MVSNFRVGRIAGIPVGVNWSVLVIAALIAWQLAAQLFPNAYPGRPAWEYVVAGLCAAVIFFVGLLAHELAHSLVAKRNGLPVRDITLWLFGGVSRLGGQAPTPGAELRIAGAGPLTSFALGVFFGAVAVAVRLLSGAGMAVGVLGWLAWINLALFVFNILPAAPLDGGRLLTAALWRWRGDRTWSAVVSARAGRGLGFILMALGVWELSATRGGFGGIWLVLLGWFLVGAAVAEERQAQLTARLTGVRVSDVMSPGPLTLPAGITVAAFLDGYPYQHRFSGFPLVRDGVPVGLLTVKRVRQVNPAEYGTVRLADIACPMSEVPITHPGDLLTDLLGRMDGCADGRALVLAEGQLVGIVTRADVARIIERLTVAAR